MPFWDEVSREVAADFPDIEHELALVDALAARCVTDPASLDVVVASNLFGDILTDLTAAVAGSLGIGAERQPRSRPAANPSLFQAIHGSAPTIAGQGIANPVAEILSVALMLEFLGEERAARGARARGGAGDGRPGHAHGRPRRHRGTAEAGAAVARRARLGGRRRRRGGSAPTPADERGSGPFTPSLISGRRQTTSPLGTLTASARESAATLASTKPARGVRPRSASSQSTSSPSGAAGGQGEVHVGVHAVLVHRDSHRQEAGPRRGERGLVDTRSRGTWGASAASSARRSETVTRGRRGDLDRGAARPRRRPVRSARRRATAARPRRAPGSSSAAARRVSWRTSRLPPFSRGGIVRSAREAYGSIAGRAARRLGPEHHRCRVGPARPRGRSRASSSSHDGATATQPRNGRPWIAMPGMSARAGHPVLDLPADQDGAVEPLGQQAEAGQDRGGAEAAAARCVSISTTSTSPGRAPRTSIGPVSGWLAPSSTDSSELASLLARRAAPSIPSRSSTTSSLAGVDRRRPAGGPGQMRLWLFAGLARIDLSALDLDVDGH